MCVCVCARVRACVCVLCLMCLLVSFLVLRMGQPLPSKHVIATRHRSASKTPFKWRFAGGPIVVRDCLLSGRLLHLELFLLLGDCLNSSPLLRCAAGWYVIAAFPGHSHLLF